MPRKPTRPTRDQLENLIRTLIQTHEESDNPVCTYSIARDEECRLLGVAVFAIGIEARALLAFLNSRNKRRLT
jgi:hypothetical protein